MAAKKMLVACIVAMLCACAVSEEVTCDHEHSGPITGAVVHKTKQITAVAGDTRHVIDVTPHGNMTAGDCSSLGTEVVHIHDCLEPYVNGIITLTYNIKLTPSAGLSSVAIYCIQVIDEVLDGDGGSVTIDNGGIGADFVEMTVTSQEKKGLKFLIEIFVNSS